MRPRPEVLDHDVARLGEFERDLASSGLAEVDADRLLPAVQRFEERGEPVRLLPHPPAEVPDRGLFDLDHLRAHIGQHDGRERPLLVAGEVEDADAGKRRRSWPEVYRRASVASPRT